MSRLVRAALLALMDRNMAAACAADTRATPGGEVAEARGLVLCRTPRGTFGTNMTIVTGPTDVATVRAATDATYGAAGRPFSLWTREHADAALEAELRAAGYREVHREPGMVLLPGDARHRPPPLDIELRAVVDDADRAAYARVASAAFAVYGAPAESTAEHFATLAAVCGPATQAFLAFRDGRAVAGALLHMAHGVGAVGWVATLPEEFGRGYGAAVTGAVVAEGERRGAAFLNLQASPLGAPLYTRLGFVTPTHYRWFLAPE